jgi:hypothetical protein
MFTVRCKQVPIICHRYHYHRYQWYRWQNLLLVVDTGGIFVIGVVKRKQEAKKSLDTVPLTPTPSSLLPLSVRLRGQSCTTSGHAW